MSLSEMMSEYYELKQQCASLEKRIKDEVLKLAKSQQVGNVKATYTKGRTLVDYKAIAEPLADSDTVYEFSEQKVDWRKVYLAIQDTVEPSIVSANTVISEPSVSLKVV